MTTSVPRPKNPKKDTQCPAAKPEVPSSAEAACKDSLSFDTDNGSLSGPLEGMTVADSMSEVEHLPLVKENNESRMDLEEDSEERDQDEGTDKKNEGNLENLKDQIQEDETNTSNKEASDIEKSDNMEPGEKVVQILSDSEEATTTTTTKAKGATTKKGGKAAAKPKAAPKTAAKTKAAKAKAADKGDEAEAEDTPAPEPPKKRGRPKKTTDAGSEAKGKAAPTTKKPRATKASKEKEAAAQKNGGALDAWVKNGAEEGEDEENNEEANGNGTTANGKKRKSPAPRTTRATKKQKAPAKKKKAADNDEESEPEPEPVQAGDEPAKKPAAADNRIIPVKEKSFTQAEMQKVFDFCMNRSTTFWSGMVKDLKINRNHKEVEKEFKKKWGEILKSYPKETETVEVPDSDAEQAESSSNIGDMTGHTSIFGDGLKTTA